MQVVLTAEIFVATPSLFQNSIGSSLRKDFWNYPAQSNKTWRLSWIYRQFNFTDSVITLRIFHQGIGTWTRSMFLLTGFCNEATTPLFLVSSPVAIVL